MKRQADAADSVEQRPWNPLNPVKPRNISKPLSQIPNSKMMHDAEAATDASNRVPPPLSFLWFAF